MDVVQHGEEAHATGEGAILVSTEFGIDASTAVAQPHGQILWSRDDLRPNS